MSSEPVVNPNTPIRRKTWLARIDNVRSLQLFQILRYGASILINILLAKSYLSLEEISVFETLMFLSTGLSFFWVSGFLKGLLPIFPGLSERDQAAFLFNAFLLFLLVSLGVTGLFWTFHDPVIRFLTEREDLPYLSWLCLYLVVNTPTYLVEYYYLLKDKPLMIVAFGLFAFGGSILAVCIPIYLGYSLLVSFQCLLVLGLAKFTWLVILVSRFGRFEINWDLLRPYLLLSFPLILNVLVSGGAEYIDGVIVHRFFDDELFAVFRYGARELPLSLALATALSAALIPQITKDMKAGMAELKVRSLRLMHLLFSISIVLMLTSPFLFPLVFNPDFALSALIFNVYLLILSSRMLFPQTILISLKYTQIILSISVLELILNVSFSLLFVQTMGLVGIAWATVLAYMVDKLLLCLYLFWKEGIAPAEYLEWRWLLLYTALLVISYWVSVLFMTT
ncbi:MAG: hypothetical protein AAF598_13945 [Bacteroidota bacterium]